MTPDDRGYREVYATEARTPNQAIGKDLTACQGTRFRAISAYGHVP